jgi:hypothetical protein
MAWQYADFEAQPDDAARLARLVLHIGEVRGQAGQATTSADGKSFSSADTTSYLRDLENRRRELERTQNMAVFRRTGGVQRHRFEAY